MKVQVNCHLILNRILIERSKMLHHSSQQRPRAITTNKWILLAALFTLLITGESQSQVLIEPTAAAAAIRYIGWMSPAPAWNYEM